MVSETGLHPFLKELKLNLTKSEKCLRSFILLTADLTKKRQCQNSRSATRPNILTKCSVRDSANQIMLYPLKDDFQEVVDHTISITGNPVVDVHIDYFGNEVGTFTHTQPHQELIIDSRLVVMTHSRLMPDNTAEPAEQWQALAALRTDPKYIDF